MGASNSGVILGAGCCEYATEDARRKLIAMPVDKRIINVSQRRHDPIQHLGFATRCQRRCNLH
jgi:hypothetical protein